MISNEITVSSFCIRPAGNYFIFRFGSFYSADGFFTSSIINNISKA
jgi:hypothetical protein